MGRFGDSDDDDCDGGNYGKFLVSFLSLANNQQNATYIRVSLQPNILRFSFMFKGLLVVYM